MDFFQICTKEGRGKNPVAEVYPDFKVKKSQDLMVRGEAFYAIWDEEAGFWSTDEYDVVRLVDPYIIEHAKALEANGTACSMKLLESFESGRWPQFLKFMKSLGDNSTQLDAKVVFANTKVKKTDYVSRRLDYSLVAGSHAAYDELMGTLYEPDELAKIEWAIGCIMSGDSKEIQKFLALYGPPGSGKGTALDIIKKLLRGYYTTFAAKSLVQTGNPFATEALKDNPLLGIDPDGDMSKIDDNSTFNSIVSHDELRLNEKFKPTYTTKINTFLIVGTNNPIKITDAKSGLIRRLIDVRPSGNHVQVDRYYNLVSQIDFELGAIAKHCYDRYKSMGKNFYKDYQPTAMILETNIMYNFLEWNYDLFEEQDGTSLTQAYTLFKTFCEESSLKYVKIRHEFRDELKNYFRVFEDRDSKTGIRSVYKGFKLKLFKTVDPEDPEASSLVMNETSSILDELVLDGVVYADLPAQYAKANGSPERYWTDDEHMVNGTMRKPKDSQVVATSLKDIDTSKVHFVKLPENHIVIDFDIVGDDGNKSLDLNLRAASEWPPTYAEISKSGAGVHLHYIYDGGDTRDLAALYSDGIEIKTFAGNASLRRRVSKTNNVPVATISSGLPFRERKTMLDVQTVKSEQGLRDLIARNLRKEFHPGTKPSMDFIAHILDESNRNGMVYDVTDLRPRLMAFANNSTNQGEACLKILMGMKFKSDASVIQEIAGAPEPQTKDGRVVLFDVEVFSNLLVVCWKYDGSDSVVRMINPTAKQIEPLFQYKLVGFNNRQYDNHILWAAFMGYNNQQLYELSQKIINKDQGCFFGEAYNLSYADIFDFASVKQGLKKWMIVLKIHHMELDIPWDQPVPEKLWPKVVEYCVNDVNGTEALFHDRKQDFAARQVLAELSGLPVNYPTRSHATKILFGEDRSPQEHFNYTDLREEFPGYEYDPYAKLNKSTYRGEEVGEGGYVYAEPGMYENVAVLDIASMHPSSIEALDLFGKYTPRFSNLKAARLAIKHNNPELAVQLMPELKDIVKGLTEEALKALAEALKLIINSIYGYTAAKFDNPFRDKRNVDNIVAKRGGLFMIDLKNAVQKRGWQVAHIKTDSIKIPNATDEIIDFVCQFGQNYGYEFEDEDRYIKFCLVNDAVYIADVAEKVTEQKTIPRHWKAVGAQFQHPVVFKGLFSNDFIQFDDLCETKEVKSPAAMYLDFNEALANPNNPFEGMHFVGRTGRFVPVNEWVGGAKLVRVKDEKPYAVTGTKNYLWLEAEMVKMMNLDVVNRMKFEDLTWAVEGTGSIIDIVDMRYYTDLVNDAVAAIQKFGDFEWFVNIDQEFQKWVKEDA